MCFKEKGGENMERIMNEIEFMNAKNALIERFVDSGVNFNMATLIIKRIAKKQKLDEAKYDLMVLCGNKKAEELYNEAYDLYNNVE